jgi:hypothetical protein
LSPTTTGSSTTAGAGGSPCGPPDGGTPCGPPDGGQGARAEDLADLAAVRKELRVALDLSKYEKGSLGHKASLRRSDEIRGFTYVGDELVVTHWLWAGNLWIADNPFP